ncbi:MAG: hypothetical protein MJ104_05110 [Lachnospiraceae bacterium]|nr:hypothetical protein [Lachnospiraceae bacterium]
MTLLYWLLEYAKILIVYMILMFAWPSLLFRKLLKGKSIRYRIAFCPTVSVVIINLVVMILGLFKILHPAVTGVLFYGSVLISIYRMVPNKAEKIVEAGRVIAGSYGIKQLFFNLFRNTRIGLNNIKTEIKKRLEGHYFEYILLAVVTVFGVVYFAYGSFRNYSYGAGDLYVHHAWIYGLLKGKIYAAGIYPEGMHSMIYAMRTLFGVNTYNAILFTGSIHTIVLLLNVYVFFREVFRSRITPILALTVFLTIDVLCVHEVVGISRLQWTLPQEFAFFTIFAVASALLRYVNGNSEGSAIEALRKIFTRKKKVDENADIFEDERKHRFLYSDELLIVMLAVSASISIHFYATGMAFLLCVAIVPFAVHKLFNVKRLVPILLSLAIGILIAIVPMVGAYATGTPFQNSLKWAISVITGDGNNYDDGIPYDDMMNEFDIFDDSIFNDSTGDLDGEDFMDSNVSAELSTLMIGAGNSLNSTVGINNQSVTTASTANSKAAMGVGNRIENFFGRIAKYSYKLLYGESRGTLIIVLSVLALIIFVVAKIANIVYVKRSWDTDTGIYLFDGYFVLVFASFLFMLFYTSRAVGLPEIIARSRLCGIAQIIICAVCLIPVDLLLWVIEIKFQPKVLVITAWIGVAAIFIVTKATGNYHGYLYIEYSRYNQAVMCTKSIIDQLPPKSYTVVSPIDELYQLAEYGYHEELIGFINDCVEKDYTIPTEYVFIFFEKKPIKYGQCYFYDGPGWLAEEKYTEYFEEYSSQAPALITANSSIEIATGPFYKFPIVSSAYSELLSRLVLESRLLKWVEDYNKLYPTELHVFYEDDSFVCYYFKQNPDCLYQLGFEEGEHYAY